MSIPYGLPEKQTHALIESTGTPNQTALAVCNADGTDIGGGGGGGDVNVTQVGGVAIALGQALAAASLPVVLTAAQITTLTPPSYAEDTAHASGDQGTMALVVREDSLGASFAGSVGDYAPLKGDANGRLYVNDFTSGAQGSAITGFYTQSTGSEAKDFDGAAFPNSTTESNLVRHAASLHGVQYVMIVNKDGSAIGSVQAKPLASSENAWSSSSSAALGASAVVKASAGNIRLVSGRVDSTAPTATYYFQLLNATSVPADGAVTHIVAPTKIQHTTGFDSPIYFEFPENGKNATTGIVWCLSSTEFTKTITAAYVSADVFYI